MALQPKTLNQMLLQSPNLGRSLLWARNSLAARPYFRARNLHRAPFRGNTSTNQLRTLTGFKSKPLLGVSSSFGCDAQRLFSTAATAAGDWHDDENADREVQEQHSMEPHDSSGKSSSTLISDAWKVNLGKRNGEDDRWLNGPRGKEWFTGVHPSQCPGLDTETGTVLRSLPLPNLERITRPHVQAYFDNTWTLFETLFAGLNGEEGFYRPAPHGLRHPQIFYYGHTACLYVNKLRVAGLLEKPVNPYFESIFEVGVDEMLWDDMSKNEEIWPAVSEVWEYRRQVYKLVKGVIDQHFDHTTPQTVTMGSSPLWALFMAMEHERIHMETSSVLFRETPHSLVQTPSYWPPLHPSVMNNATAATTTRRKTSYPVEGEDYPANKMTFVDETTTVQLGKPRDFPSFGWDNEYGTRQIRVPPFGASQFMISNGEFWNFVKDGGYREQQHWCDDGWAWRTHRNAKWPFFWQAAGPEGSHEFDLRTIFDVVAMPWDWPVDVNYYEAKAYCRWNSSKEEQSSNHYRVLTEAEHHVLRGNLEHARANASADDVLTKSGHAFVANDSSANLNLAYSSQNPVNALVPSQTGHFDVAGSAWEWTEDHFNPLDGFEIHPVYDDFSTPCFDGKHNMIVGGSFISTGDEASVFARFHFRPHFLQHSGFRLVTSEQEAPHTHLTPAAKDIQSQSTPKANVYESDDSLNMYLGLHYPQSGAKEGLPPILPHDNSPTHGLFFPQRVAQLLNRLRPERYGSALDIGCAVGGSSFELAKSFDTVDAFDYSHSFIEAARRMQKSDGDNVRFRVTLEADIAEDVLAAHDDEVAANVRAKVNFFTGDACEIQAMKARGVLGTYDGVIMSNLLCRLPNPTESLRGLPLIVSEGGVVVLVTPFTWLEEFTPRSNWLGGFYDESSGKAVHSKDTLQHLMESNGFEKIHEEDMPLVIREHARKYQYIVSAATGWRKR